MSDDEVDAIIKNYGNEKNDIKYLEFINDSNPYKGPVKPFDPLATKSTYSPNIMQSGGP